MNRLTESHKFDIRFSEVDSMNIVWHGSYTLYFEDAREAFGKKYGLGYMTIFSNGYFAPLVELSFKYKKPLAYGMKPSVVITYVPTEAAKIVFDYQIIDDNDSSVIATGHSVQVLWTRIINSCGRIPNSTANGKRNGRFYDCMHRR